MENSADLLSERRSAPTPGPTGRAPTGLQRSGVDLAGYSIPEEVDDIEAARRALGYQRIDLLSESAGTRVAMIYSWRYPNEHRSLGDDRRQSTRQLPLGRKDDQRADQRYSALCAPGGVPAAARTPTSPRRMQHTVAHVPSTWLFLPIKPGDVTGRRVPRADNDDLRGFATVRANDPRLVALRRARRPKRRVVLVAVARLTFPTSFVWGESLASIGRREATTRTLLHAPAQTVARSSAIPSQRPDLGRQAASSHAWPVNPGENEYTHVQNSNVPTLLIGGNARLRNAARERHAGAAAAPRERPSGRPLGLGHADDFDAYEPSAGTQLLTTYLDTGRSTRPATPRMLSASQHRPSRQQLPRTSLRQ